MFGVFGVTPICISYMYIFLRTNWRRHIGEISIRPPFLNSKLPPVPSSQLGIENQLYKHRCVKKMFSSAATLIAIAAVSCPIFYFSLIYYYKGPAGRKRALSHIPELRLEKDDTSEGYRQNTRSLLRAGYEKYLQYGVPFQMYNPVGELGNQVVLPMKYLDEVKRAPKSLYSFETFSEKIFLLNYTNAPRQTVAATYAVKLDVNMNLGKDDQLHICAFPCYDVLGLNRSAG